MITAEFLLCQTTCWRCLHGVIAIKLENQECYSHRSSIDTVSVSKKEMKNG